MKTIVHPVIYSSRGETFCLWHLTDLHLGARACDEKLLQQHINQIRDDPHALWIGGGDYIDCIARGAGDKRYQEDTQAAWLHGKNDAIDLQCERFFSMIEPIADKCIGLVNGNHEHNALRHYDRDVYRHIVRGVAHMKNIEPGALALNIGGFIRLRFRRQSPNSQGKGEYWTLNVFAHHGAGGGRLAGGDALMLERALGTFAEARFNPGAQLDMGTRDRIWRAATLDIGR